MTNISPKLNGITYVTSVIGNSSKNNIEKR